MGGPPSPVIEVANGGRAPGLGPGATAGAARRNSQLPCAFAGGGGGGGGEAATCEAVGASASCAASAAAAYARLRAAAAAGAGAGSDAAPDGCADGPCAGACARAAAGAVAGCDAATTGAAGCACSGVTTSELTATVAAAGAGAGAGPASTRRAAAVRNVRSASPCAPATQQAASSARRPRREMCSRRMAAARPVREKRQAALALGSVVCRAARFPWSFVPPLRGTRRVKCPMRASATFTWCCAARTSALRQCRPRRQ